MIEYGDANSAPADLRLRGGLAAKEEEEEDDHCDNSLLALLILPNCLQIIISLPFACSFFILPDITIFMIVFIEINVREIMMPKILFAKLSCWGYVLRNSADWKIAWMNSVNG